MTPEEITAYAGASSVSVSLFQLRDHKECESPVYQKSWPALPKSLTQILTKPLNEIKRIYWLNCQYLLTQLSIVRTKFWSCDHQLVFKFSLHRPKYSENVQGSNPENFTWSDDKHTHSEFGLLNLHAKKRKSTSTKKVVLKQIACIDLLNCKSTEIR